MMPKAISFLGAYDSWRNDNKTYWNESILPFQYGMRLICNSPETFPVEFLDGTAGFYNILNTGKTVLEYQKQVNQFQAKTTAFEINLMGFRCICMNTTEFNSTAFEAVYDELKHDVMMPFQFNGEKWRVSLYTTKENIDCSVIAKSMGGGGHKDAAGFKVGDIREIIS